MNTPTTGSNRGRIGVDFVDVLFAIVMGISATNNLELAWVKQDPGFVWQASFAFEIGVLLLGYITLITSWVGYHQSEGTNAQEIRDLPGWVTFIIDILLLACYLLILTKFESFGLVLFVLFIVFSFYVIWDIFRQRQRGSPNEERLGRMGVSRFWAVCFASLLGVYLIIFGWLDLTETILDAAKWVILLLAIAGVVLYRFHKSKTKTRNWLSPALDVLMFQRPKWRSSP